MRRLKTCGLLLAAGASRRFGDDDKLLARLGNRPLIAYAASAIQKAGVEQRLAVISNPGLRPCLDGFEIVEVGSSAQSDSLLAGLAAAADCDRLLIALSDMPFVTAALLDKVLHTTADDCPAASVDDGKVMPPACFPKSWFNRLRALNGDQGARQLLRDLPPAALVPAQGLLVDVDTVAQLAQLQGRL